MDSVIDTNNVIVAVIDSGIDIEHDALKDNIFVNSAEIANNSDSGVAMDILMIFQDGILLIILLYSDMSIIK